MFPPKGGNILRDSNGVCVCVCAAVRARGEEWPKNERRVKGREKRRELKK